MSGEGELTTYDEGAVPAIVPDEGPAVETIDDRLNDLREVVSDHRIETKAGLKRGELTRMRRSATHDT